MSFRIKGATGELYGHVEGHQPVTKKQKRNAARHRRRGRGRVLSPDDYRSRSPERARDHPQYRERTPLSRGRSPMRHERSPTHSDRSRMHYERSLMHREESPTRYQQSPVRYEQSATDHVREHEHSDTAPFRGSYQQSTEAKLGPGDGVPNRARLSRRSRMTCYRCGKLGHIAHDCELDKETAAGHAAYVQGRIKDRDRYDQRSSTREQGLAVSQDFVENLDDKGNLTAQGTDNWVHESNSYPEDTQASVSRVRPYDAPEDEVDWDDEALESGENVHVTSSLPHSGHSYNTEQSRYQENSHVQPRRISSANREMPTKPAAQNYERTRDLETQPNHSIDSHGLGRKGRTNIQFAPPTAYDLRNYDLRITREYRELPEDKRFFNGNGKVSPHTYGSASHRDFGMCYTTFLTKHRCEMGIKCPWRHHPLCNAEKEWIRQCGGARGRIFLHNAEKWWASPEVPIPGANLEVQSV